ncbi:hypothetical protein BV20DRAFT_972034 [Pilatotrama ljubarskyi]|nr:hypothetical protein BV20DRAFT_972034 [Pilatotrama ljubarskyi]
MAPRQRDAPPAPGLLASAFSFVTREIESFVTAATGGEVLPKQPQEEDQPQASSSRVRLDGKGRDRDEAREEREREREREKRGKRVRKQSEVDSERARARRRVRREEDDGSDDERDRALRAMKKKVQPAPRARSWSSEREAADDEDDQPAPAAPPKKPARKRREAAEDPGPAEDVARNVDEVAVARPKKQPAKSVCKSTDPSELMPPPPTPMRPPPSPAEHLMTPAPTMPGSLFPRSASLMPEPIPSNLNRAVPRPRTPTPPPEPIQEERAPVCDDGVDESPTQAPRRQPSRDDQAREQSDRIADAAGPSSLAETSRRSESSERGASSSGKSLDEAAEPAPRARSAKGKERAYDTSGEIRVRGKERELREAREDHARNAHERDDSERERDKQRIRMLEEEVARLRAELALKTNASMMPPPPPPPPPPPLFRPQAPTSSSEGGPQNFLASARASLRPAGPPVEAPINSAAYGGARTKKAGQPTVNVPSDKMAAFLREMKNVRLRRVGGTGNTSMAPPASTSGAAGDLSRSTSGNGMSRARMAATLGERSFDLGVATRLEIGEKRKRDMFQESQAGPSKRRETTFVRSEETGGSSVSGSQSSAPSSQSSSSSSSARSSTSRTSFVEVAAPRSQPSRPRTSAPLRIWPTVSTADTDLTTPSLCSDNENDHEHEEKLPDTPSDSGRDRGRSKDAKSAASYSQEPGPEHEVIDVDALETPLKHRLVPKSPTDDKTNLFARRPPASPLPVSAKTPNKPKPPARAAKSKIPLPLPRRVPFPPPELQIADESESDDPLAAAPARPERRGRARAAYEDGAPSAGPSRLRRDSSASPSVRSHSRARDGRPESRMSNHARRRLTLDEELRRAGDSLWQPSDEEEQGAGEEEQEEEDMDSGTLVALGTRSSKRGFLARGGGAGPPVFMGEGYVQGAVSEDPPVGETRSRSGTGESSRRGAARR